MAAAQAVLETVELFEQIIIQLPAQDIVIFKRVSLTWKERIVDSHLIQQFIDLPPLQRTSIWSSLEAIHDADEQLTHPCYFRSENIRYHPQFYMHNETVLDGDMVFSRDIMMLHECTTTVQYRRSYATMPPCQAIWVRPHGSGIRATVYSKKGVTIGDLLDAMHGMRGQHGGRMRVEICREHRDMLD